MSPTTDTTDLPATIDEAHRRHLLWGEPMIFHCHHYNTFLQRSIQDASYIDSTPFLVGAAAEVAYGQLSSTLSLMEEVEDRKTLATKVYAWAGFGRLDLSDLGPDGGTVLAPTSHYGSSWKAKFGPSERSVDVFTRGWLAGAAAAIFGAPNGAYTVEQTSCLSTGADVASFSVTRERCQHPVWAAVGAGPLSTHRPRPVQDNNVDYDGIYTALVGMPIVGDEKGLIPAFGVYLTHHYANYYNRISFELERAMSEKFGDDGVEATRPLLVEAGHVCAFYTFGGIMTSTEWDALIRPSLRTKEDWVHGMVAATNALGWGRWQVTDVSERSATFVIHDDYESVGHLAMYGEADHPVSYLAEGGVRGLMNLVYLGGIEDHPEFTPELYERSFKGARSYEATVVASRAMGDEATVFEVVAPE